MMYIDYKKDSIVKKSNENLINAIHHANNIEKEVILKYIEIYDDYPFMTFSDTETTDAKLIRERLKIISRSFKIKKIKDKTCVKLSIVKRIRMMF